MLFADFRKKRERKGLAKEALPAEEGHSSQSDALNVEETPPKFNAQKDIDDIHGLELKAYAQKYDLSTEAVWESIRSGNLVARTENGFVYVYGASFPNKIADDAPSPPRADEVSVTGLPPLPADSYGTQGLVVAPDQGAELAVLFDHLNHAREQNIELLRISQNSIMQIRDMSEQVISAKNEVIAEKNAALQRREQELLSLKEQLEQEKSHNLRLKQNLEDMEMLTKTLGI